MSESKEEALAPTNTLLKADHYLVGIGASAGGLEAIHKLFDHFPSNSSFSFVIIQHLSPDHKSLMAELLSKHTSMKVREAEDNMLTRPNCVYVLPSGKLLTLQHGRLRLAEKERNREPNFAIDVFLESLAKDMGRYAIGIVLSGTGTDGTKGCKAIKAAGGMVVVQDPETAKFDGMPRSAIDTGNADYVLSPEKMASEIIAYTKKLPLIHALIASNQESSQDNESVLNEILDLVCTHTQTDFKNYKQATIFRRIEKRIGNLKVNSLQDYLNYMHENPSEIKLLCQEFFIGVTQFFRDPDAFHILEEEIIPRIVAGKLEDEYVKVWVTACSTGEEVYSLAILFKECFDKLGRKPLIKLFATDIDQRAITQASKGSFPLSIAKDMTPERLQRFFYQKGNKYFVNEDIRKFIVFAQHDLQKDPPFSRIDLITCRNMLIYLNSELQKKVLSLFPYALNLYGYLFLGSSEHIGDLRIYFYEESRKWKLYKKIKESSSSKQPSGAKGYMPVLSAEVKQDAKNGQVSRYNETFMDAVSEDFKITGLYVDENYQLLHGIGDISRFLQFPNKRLHFNLLKMVPEELGVTLSVAIRKAIKNNQRVEARQVAIKIGKTNTLIHITVKPIESEKDQPKVILVLLQEGKQTSPKIKFKDLAAASDADIYQQLSSLEMELKEAREGLQLTVQDLSTSNEELQSSNEELMSSNEELQSSNEEMQSLNEELHTVNAEHQLKIRELQELNEDLDNYIRSSNVGQLFVDHHLVIRKFTPSVKNIINIIETDLGRPVHHLAHNLKYNELQDDIRSVNNSSIDIEKEVETVDGKYYLMRIIPYLKHDGNKDGLVLSFVEITTLKTLSNVVQGVLNSSLNSIMAFKAVRDENKVITDFTWSLLNKKAEELVGKPYPELFGNSILTELTYLKKSGLFNKYIKVTNTSEPLHIEYQLEIGGEKKWYEIAAVKMGDGVTVTMGDVTEKRNSEEKILLAYEEIKRAEENLIKLNDGLEKRVEERTQALAASEERFRLVSRATNDVVWDWDMVNNELWWSESLTSILGYDVAQMGAGINAWYSKVHPDDHDQMVKKINDTINFGKDQWTDEYRIVRADGTYAYVANRAYILHNEYGIPYRVLGSFIDLSDLKEAQEQLQSTNEHLVRVNEDLDTFVYTASHDLKAPMANIEGLLVLLEEQVEASEPLPGEPTGPLFEMLKDSINRFKNVIIDLTDIAKIQRDVDGDAEELAFQEVLSTAKLNISNLLKEHEGARINASFEDAPTINFSRKNLYSILYNLLSNAVKYSSPDRVPEVTIKTELLDGFVLFTIKDNGLGISQENLPKMFTLFKRFHSHVEGTGMGLYIVKRMMDNAGGKIEIESEEGKGTTLHLYFKTESHKNQVQLVAQSLDQE